MNKDGTLDSSKLFNSVNQFFPKKEAASKSQENEVFKTENNTSMKAHSGSTIVLPCLVEKEGQFEMVRLLKFSLEKTLESLPAFRNIQYR